MDLDELRTESDLKKDMISTENGFRHRKCVPHQGEYFENLCRSPDW